MTSLRAIFLTMTCKNADKKSKQIDKTQYQFILKYMWSMIYLTLYVKINSRWTRCSWKKIHQNAICRSDHLWMVGMMMIFHFFFYFLFKFSIGSKYFYDEKKVFKISILKDKNCYINLGLHILKFFPFIFIKILLNGVIAFRTQSLLNVFVKTYLTN